MNNSNKELTIDTFIDFFISYSNRVFPSEEIPVTMYNSDKEWTRNFFSPPKSLERGSPFGDSLIAEFNQLKYRTEDGLVDMAIAGKDNFYFSEIGNAQKEFWPINYKLLIEHENDIYSCWQELVKMSYLKSDIKVLITYNSKNTKIETENRMVYEWGNAIIKKSSDQSKYIIIIGRLISDELIWDIKIL